MLIRGMESLQSSNETQRKCIYRGYFTHLFVLCLNITTTMMSTATKTITAEREMILMIRDMVETLSTSVLLVLSALPKQLMLMSIEGLVFM